MRLEVLRFSPEWKDAIEAFNMRLAAGEASSDFRLPLDPDQELQPGSLLHLAIQGGLVRGGYILRPQEFSFSGLIRRVAHYRLPISEGLVDRSFAHVGPILLRTALRQEPLLYALGMGGGQQPLPRMLQAHRWAFHPVPFFFRAVHPRRLFRQVTAARGSAWRSSLMDLAAFSGAAWIGLKTAQWLRTRHPSGQFAWDEIEDFGGWADELWLDASKEYRMTAVRDTTVLRRLYKPGDRRFLRLRVKGAGWAILLDTRMQGDRYFGNLRVGTIVDCMAKPENAGLVIHAARTYLEQRGVDLIISNQNHAAWLAALRADGFLQARSNFFFAASPPLAELAGPAAGRHLTRGDGDGPIHL